MNIILFQEEEIHHPLSREDRRGRHILEILNAHEGDLVKIGVLNGPLGEGRIEKIDSQWIYLNFRFFREDEPLYPLHLIIGLPRPQTVKKVLQDAAALGVSSLYFVGTELGEKSYASSKVWKENQYVRYAALGVEQARATILPEVKRYWSLRQCLESLPGSGDRIAFDNHPEAGLVREFSFSSGPCFAALGSERGWSDRERELLREEGFTFLHLGKRPLRLETAVVAGGTLILEYKKLL